MYTERQRWEWLKYQNTGNKGLWTPQWILLDLGGIQCLKALHSDLTYIINSNQLHNSRTLLKMFEGPSCHTCGHLALNVSEISFILKHSSGKNTAVRTYRQTQSMTKQSLWTEHVFESLFIGSKLTNTVIWKWKFHRTAESPVENQVHAMIH